MLAVAIPRSLILAQNLPGEDINAHGGEVALRLLRLLFELDDVVVLIDVHDAKGRSDLPRNGTDCDGDVRAGFDMSGEHLVIIHLVDMVAGQDQNVLGIILLDEVDILVDGIGGAAVPFAALGSHIGRKHKYAAVAQVEVPRLAGTDIAIKLERLILRENTYSVNLRIGAVRQREIDDAILAAERNCRLL